MPILALVTEYCELPEEQVVVLFQILAAEINFGYKFQTVRYPELSVIISQMHTLGSRVRYAELSVTIHSSHRIGSGSS